MVKVLLTFHIDSELIEKIKAVDEDIEILYDPDLLGKPRYLNDQHGGVIDRTMEQKAKLESLMAEAEIVFGYVPRGYYGDIK